MADLEGMGRFDTMGLLIMVCSTTNDSTIDTAGAREREELRNILLAAGKAEWRRHDVTGEQVKRICLAESMIDRVTALLSAPTSPGHCRARPVAS